MPRLCTTLSQTLQAVVKAGPSMEKCIARYFTHTHDGHSLSTDSSTHPPTPSGWTSRRTKRETDTPIDQFSSSFPCAEVHSRRKPWFPRDGIQSREVSFSSQGRQASVKKGQSKGENDRTHEVSCLSPSLAARKIVPHTSIASQAQKRRRRLLCQHDHVCCSKARQEKLQTFLINAESAPLWANFSSLRLKLVPYEGVWSSGEERERARRPRKSEASITPRVNDSGRAGQDE